MKKLCRTLISCSLLTWSFLAFGQDIYVDIPTIPGDATRAGFEGQIVSSGVSGTFSEKTCGDIIVLKEIDIASPALITAAVNKVIINRATISYVTTGGTTGSLTTTQIRLLDVAVQSVSTKVDPDEVTTIEEVRLRAANVEIEYQDQNADGTPAGTYTAMLDCGNPK